MWWCIVSVWVQCGCLCTLGLAVLGHWRHTCAILSLMCHPALRSLTGGRAADASASAALFATQSLAKPITPHCLPRLPPRSPQKHSYTICPWWEKDPKSPPLKMLNWQNPLLLSVSPTQSFFRTLTPIEGFLHVCMHVYNKMDRSLMHCWGCCVRAVNMNLLTSMLFALFFLFFVFLEEDSTTDFFKVVKAV